MTQASSIYTVKDVIDKANEIFFGENHHNHTEEQWAFKQKLFKLTRERKTKEVGQCNDIDAAAFLSEDEYKILVGEAESLK